MRFLMFNLVVVGALFYLLTGGNIQQAKTLMESDTAQAAKGRAEQIVGMAKQAVGDLTQKVTQPEKPVSKVATALKDTYTAPVKSQTQQLPVSKSETLKTAELPPLDGEKVVKPHVTYEAPDGVSPGVVERQEPVLQQETIVAQVETNDELVPSEEKRLARKKELSRMVFDMERLFAEKLVR
ncbi:MAG: hypothetical protein OQJ97_15070 [Rhodospirillales bacterium]|nr:hypothetical protein [Rhodospirillales bacterium]